MVTDLHGRVALVTGAGTGIGRSIATHLAQAGAAVGLFGRRREPLESTAEEIEAAGGRALVLPGDVTVRADVDGAVDAIATTFGPISILVNSAGRSQPYGPIGVVDPERWWQTQAIHVLGPVLFMNAVLPEMRRRREGRVFNVSSMAGTMRVPGSSAYCVSKSTITRLSEIVSLEQQDSGVLVFALHPGSILTDMVRTGLEDPDAPRRPLNPDMASSAPAELDRVGAQAVELAGGAYDELAGGLLNLEVPLASTLDTRRMDGMAATP